MDTDTLTQGEAARLQKVLKTLREMLLDRGYDLSAVTWPSTDIVDSAGGDRSGLTLLVQHAKRGQQWLYVFFPNDAKVGVRSIRDIGARMDRNGVTRALLIVRDSVTPFARGVLTELTSGAEDTRARKQIDVFHEDELLVNVLKHQDQPEFTVLTPKEKRALLERYKCKEAQLPRMGAHDPVARHFGLRRGQVLKIKRPSETAGICFSYRVIV